MQRFMSMLRCAIDKYNMIEDGDRIAVGISGGKDSVALLCGLAEMRRFYPKKFEVCAVTIDPKFGGQKGNYKEITELCHRLNVPYLIKVTDLWEIIFEIRKESNPCSLCARMRRGALHDAAKSISCNKVALGHHLDDAAETFYMNLFQGGTLGSFQPVSYLSRKNIHLIRPMILIEEREITNLANRLQLPIVKSKCPADGCTERQRTKELLSELGHRYPDIKQKTIKALQKSHITGW